MKAELIIKTIEQYTAENGDIKLILTAPQAQRGAISALMDKYRKDKEKDTERLYGAEIAPYNPKRSLSANAYFHLLVGKIATKLRKGAEELKKEMVLEYGTIATDEYGGKVGFKLPVSVNIDSIYPYAKWFDEREEGGKKFNCYIIYKQTHTLDSAEMARLIEGVIQEANELGIETITPEEKAKMLAHIKEE